MFNKGTLPFFSKGTLPFDFIKHNVIQKLVSKAKQWTHNYEGLTTYKSF